MGDMANDIVQGWCCEWCCMFFKREHGYPVICDSCWEDATKEEKELVTRATEKLVGG